MKKTQLEKHLFESFQSVLPAPSIIIDIMRPSIIIRLGSPREDTEVDSTAPTHTLASTVTNFSALKLFLRKGLVAPIITWRCYQSPVPCAEALVLQIGILASSLDQQDFALRQRS